MGIVGNRGLTDFLPIFLSWVDDPDCVVGIPQAMDAEDRDYLARVESDLDMVLTDGQKWWAVGKRRELGEMFNQEYPYSAEAAFASVRDGTYYARLWRDKGTVVESGLYDEALDVYTSWDLGMNDTTEIGMWQIHMGKPRLVDYYYNSGEGLEHYVRVLRLRGYAFKEHFLPHDVKVKELGMAKSRFGILYDLGMRNMTVLPRTRSVSNDIEVVRRMLPYLAVDNSTCSRVVKAFGRYTKQWDSNLGVFKDKPLHDEWSNPMDMVRYFAMSGVWSDKGRGEVPVKKRVRGKRSGANI